MIPLPRFIKRPPFLLYIRTRAHLTESLRWRYAKQKDKCRVFYGHKVIPSKDNFASGGIIKFQDLQDFFPNTLHNPNLLYLLNSALYHCSDLTVKYAKKNGAKFLLNQNGVAYFGWHGPGWEKINEPMKLLIREADYIFYQSEFSKLSADLFLGNRDRDFEILYNPVDTNIFKPLGDRIDINRNNLKLLMIGSYHEIYRVKAVLQAFSHICTFIPKAHLTIAGRCVWSNNEQMALEELMEMARDLKILDKMEFIGAYPQIKAPEIYRNSHILLHTKYNDPCPRVVVEAMACGLPVVYSSSGGVPELVGEKAGIGLAAPLDWDRMHPPDPELMAEAVMNIVPAYNSYSREARRRAVEKLDVRPWIKRHQEIFHRLTSG